MQAAGPQPDALTFAWRLAATFFFVAANGFFVAAEFALVKVRATRLANLAESGSRRARIASHVHTRLDRYLSACQLGITVSSLILGWLSEPAVAELLLAGAAASGFEVSPGDPLLHGIALAVAITIITILHMTLGEQAPKIWAIKRAEVTALQVAIPLQVFEWLFRPFIWMINEISNGMLRMVGISSEELGEASHNVQELRGILATSAEAGHISTRQLELTDNILSIIGLEARHILVPRVDVAFLSLQSPPEENLGIIRQSHHSRFPLCQVGLDSVVGFVHTKDVMTALIAGLPPDLASLARKPLFVPDTQPLSQLIVRMQRTRSHCAVVVDEHGTSVGLAFLEDALEEIVGPIGDEFDRVEDELPRREGDAILMPGALALPEAAELLDLPDLGDESDTIGGHVVSLLGRLARKDDELEIGGYRVVVEEVSRRRVERLCFTPRGMGREEAAADETPPATTLASE